MRNGRQPLGQGRAPLGALQRDFRGKLASLGARLIQGVKESKEPGVIPGFGADQARAR